MLYEALQPLLAPVVLISACGLMIMALNARAMTSKSRIRQLHHERLEIAEFAAAKCSVTPTQRLRYQGVGEQSVHLLARLRLMRVALMCMVGCVVLMLFSSLSIGLANLDDDNLFDELAVATFVSGIVCMLAGTVTFLIELRVSLKEITYEHQRILALELPEPEDVPIHEGTRRAHCGPTNPSTLRDR